MMFKTIKWLLNAGNPRTLTRRGWLIYWAMVIVCLAAMLGYSGVLGVLWRSLFADGPSSRLS
jgi:hypothetical protein